jgi:type I restriction enzyme, S subunit
MQVHKMEKNDLPFGWKITNLDDICNLITDGTHDKTPLVDKSIGTPLVTSKDLDVSGISFKNVLYITREQHEQIMRRSKPEKGDILYSKIGTIGKPTIVDVDFEFSIKNVALFKLKNELIFNKYLRFYLNHRPVHNLIEKKAGGGNQKFIPLNKLKKIQVIVPPLATQKKLVSILEKVEETKKLRAQADELTNQLLQNVFLEMFGDPVKNPKGWEKKKLILLIKKETKISYGIVQPGDEFNNGVCVVRPVDIINNELIYDNIKKISPQIESKFKKTRLLGDEILITVRGTTGNTALTNHRVKGFNVTRGIAVIRPDNNIINKIYLNEFLKSENGRRYIQEHTKGATLRQINIQDLKIMPILVPPLTLQNKFASIVEKFDMVNEKQKQSKNEIVNFFEVLMQKAFTGELVA